mmetsp:Transcript_93397/g.145759  ORF Transcript_93397/g.145759 Transcript_93397/m.145759 type:complete len:371 (-) Transcript_93397:74-1186(-)
MSVEHACKPSLPVSAELASSTVDRERQVSGDCIATIGCGKGSRQTSAEAPSELNTEGLAAAGAATTVGGAVNDAFGLRTGADTNRATEGCRDTTDGVSTEACGANNEDDCKRTGICMATGASSEAADGGLLIGTGSIAGLNGCPPLLPRTREATSVITSAAQILTSSSESSSRLTIALMTSKARPSPTAESAAAATALCHAKGSTPGLLLNCGQDSVPEASLCNRDGTLKGKTLTEFGADAVLVPIGNAKLLGTGTGEDERALVEDAGIIPAILGARDIDIIDAGGLGSRGGDNFILDAIMSMPSEGTTVLRGFDVGEGFANALPRLINPTVLLSCSTEGDGDKLGLTHGTVLWRTQEEEPAPCKAKLLD